MNEMIVFPSLHLNNAVGHNFLSAHPNYQGDISVSILARQRNALKRKLSEALCIYRDRPLLNDKTELENIVKNL